VDLGNKIMQRRKALGLTLEEVGKIVGVGKSTVRKWESGDIANMGRSKIALLAIALNVSPLYIMGLEDNIENNKTKKGDIKTTDLPIVGKASCGKGSFAIEETEGYETTPIQWLNGGEYFYIRAIGDSMKNARINDGDLILICKQSDVDDGDIAAVLIDETIYLKRVFKRNNTIILQSENPDYAPIVYETKKHNCVIIGKLKKIIITQP
jgi:repressor LexA